MPTFELTLTPDIFIPDATNHPDRGVIQDRAYLAFDDTTVETAISKAIRWPTVYTSETVKAKICYAMATATSGNVDFEVSVEAISDGDTVDTDTASSFDTVNAANETVPGTAGYISILEITLTNKDSVAAGDMVRIKLERDSDDATNDTAAGDARVFWVVLETE